MFLKFNGSEERRAYGGGDFIEMQYCKMPLGTPEREIVRNENIIHWETESLYVYGDDTNRLYDEYADILNEGIYSNLEKGVFDCLGINYYNEEKTQIIIKLLREKKPENYEAFLEWLLNNTHNNGFYLLGV